MRINSLYTEILQIIRDSNIELIVGVPNDKLQALANPSATVDWVQNKIKEYSSNVVQVHCYWKWSKPNQ